MLLSHPTTGEALTQEVPREVDRQDDGHREHTNQHQQDQEVPLEGEVGGGVDPTLALNLLVPGGDAGGGERWWCLPTTSHPRDTGCFGLTQPMPTHGMLCVACGIWAQREWGTQAAHRQLLPEEVEAYSFGTGARGQEETEVSPLPSLLGGCFRRALLSHWSQQLWVMCDHLWAWTPQGQAAVRHGCNAEDTHLLHLVDRNEPGAESLEWKRVGMSWGRPPPSPRRGAGTRHALGMCVETVQCLGPGG